MRDEIEIGSFKCEKVDVGSMHKMKDEGGVDACVKEKGTVWRDG